MRIATSPDSPAWALPFRGRQSITKLPCSASLVCQPRRFGTATSLEGESCGLEPRTGSSLESQTSTSRIESETVGAWRRRLRLKKVSKGMASILLPRRWFVLVYLVLGVNAAAYLRPAARPLLNIIDSKGLTDELEQVHTSLAGENYMKVTWITSSSSVPSVVEYGTSPSNYNSVVTGTKDRYYFLTYRSGEIHNVVIGPLESNTTYYYRCGRMGKEYRLKTPPSELPITFAVVGDLGQTEWTVSTLDHVQKSNYDLLLFAGDLSYADLYQPRWDSFGRLVESSASTRPWMVTEGNHEIEKIPILVNSFKAYNARWRMPFEQSGSASNLYYSFDVPGSHVVMLGSYADYDKDSSQFKWLQADLAKIDRKSTPWLIVMLHAPWYNSNTAHQGEGEEMRRAIEPMLNAAKADILFAGHVHAYERWGRMYDEKANPCGMVHITIGDGGNREGLAKEYINPQPQWSLFREASFGHGELLVVNSTHAQWSWHRNDDDEDTVADEVWITSLSDPSNTC